MIASILLLCQQPELLRSWPNRVTTLKVMPDIDGDGLPELLAGNHLFSTPTLTNAGRLQVVSSGGSVLFDVVGTFSINLMGFKNASVGDVDGDGLSDFMVSGGSGQARIFSGRTGESLFTHATIATDAISTGDMNRDGIGDFLLGAGRVYLYHGVSFTLRQEIVPPVGVRAFGTAVASLGDIDGDGFIDFAVGAPGLGNSKGGPPGEALVYSGQEGRLLYRLPGIAPADDFGRTLASPGDFTGDGLYDLVVGAPLCCDPDDLSGRVSFYDGKSGELLRRLDPVNGFLFGLQMDEFGDLDGNGQVDALVRMERFGGVSGLAIDGHSQETFRAYDVGFTALAADGYDWNDDGFPDYLLGDLGGIELFSGAPPRTEVLGEPCGTLLGRAPRIGATRAPVIGEPYLVHLSEVPPGVTAILRLGALGKPSLLPTGGQRGCAFTGSTMAEIKVRTQKLGPGRGAATVEFPIPADPALLDQSFSVQWTVLGLRGIPAAHTRVLRPRIGQ